MKNEYNSLNSAISIITASDSDFVNMIKSKAVNATQTAFMCARMTNAPFSNGTIAAGFILYIPNLRNNACVVYIDCYAKTIGVHLIDMTK